MEVMASTQNVERICNPSAADLPDFAGPTPTDYKSVPRLTITFIHARLHLRT
ncbi:MAG: hypothetical protein ACI8UO_005610 [Verrucomicrobiales bacterium]|jgi:hypothetical protein